MAFFISGLLVYSYLFYPRQSMPIGEPVAVTTIEPEKYHNDCLHPCIRYCKMTDSYYMASSPYYAWNNKVENPMLYVSNTFNEWADGKLIRDTPEHGYNSDPNLWVSDSGYVNYLWRECQTPLCDSLGCISGVVGGNLEGGALDNIYCINYSRLEDTDQCPIMIKRDDKYYIYAAWYQYAPVRKNLGIAIWKGASLTDTEYVLQETVPFESVYTVDKAKNIPLFGHLFYLPKPLRHDLWHFDLFEYNDNLYMVSVAEKGDNIMMSVAEDWKHFRTFRKPLVNNHYQENYCGYRQHYYKPTALVRNDSLYLYYTANAQDDPKRNQLFLSIIAMKDLL